MSDLFEFPTIPFERDLVALYQTPRHSFPAPEEAAAWAERLGTRGQVEDLGSRLVVRDRSGSFELFVASGSIRWSRREAQDMEAPATADLPSDDEATRIAELFLCPWP